MRRLFSTTDSSGWTACSLCNAALIYKCVHVCRRQNEARVWRSGRSGRRTSDYETVEHPDCGTCKRICAVVCTLCTREVCPTCCFVPKGCNHNVCHKCVGTGTECEVCRYRHGQCIRKAVSGSFMGFIYQSNDLYDCSNHKVFTRCNTKGCNRMVCTHCVSLSNTCSICTAREKRTNFMAYILLRYGRGTERSFVDVCITFVQ